MFATLPSLSVNAIAGLLLPIKSFKESIWRLAIAGIAFALAAKPLTAQEAAIAGVWLIETPVPAIRTVDGELPPLKPQSRALYEERVRSRMAGDIYFDRTTWCASPGMPRFMLMPYTFSIVIGDSHVAFLYEWYDWYRVVRTAEPFTEVVYPISMGFPNGRWETTTLIIETRGIMEETILDSAGLPHSEDMVLTERLRLTEPDVLESVMTIEDPAHYLEPWQFRTSYRRQEFAPVAEEMCVDSISRGEPAIRNQ